MQDEIVYRRPTELERTFLRIVTRGHTELSAQAELCYIAEYDSTGWVHVRPTGGTRVGVIGVRGHVDGPKFKSDDERMVYVETLLWWDKLGMLEEVEIVRYGDDSDPDWTPYSHFVERDADGRLTFPELPRAGNGKSRSSQS
jgi:hypothetical protein